MATSAHTSTLAQQARRSYAERLLEGVPTLVQAVEHGAKVLSGAAAEPAVAAHRRTLIGDLHKAAPTWLSAITTPVIEVQLSDPEKRESFRQTDLVALAATKLLKGEGARGYSLALDAAARL